MADENTARIKESFVKPSCLIDWTIAKYADRTPRWTQQAASEESGVACDNRAKARTHLKLVPRGIRATARAAYRPSKLWVNDTCASGWRIVE